MTESTPSNEHLFAPDDQHPIRVVCTGQVGLDKKDFLEQVVELGRQRGKEITLFNVGERMYAEAPDVAPGRILDLPKPRLDQLRRSVFKDILAEAEKGNHLIVNTHATFRWKHGLFPAFDHKDMSALNADLYITLLDNVDAIHERLERDHDIRHTLKDILVWREEESVVTATMAEAISGYGKSYIVSRGETNQNVETFYRLMFEPKRKRVYPSFPMTHVMDMPETLAEIDHFRARIAEHFITFDPGDVDEKEMLIRAGQAMQRGEEYLNIHVNDRDIQLRTVDISAVAYDIDAQIYARDFQLIDQSHMIVSYIPELPTGKPGLSSGVERELQHAWENTKEVYVIWTPKCEPSPFVTAPSTKVFNSIDELFAHFKEKGYIQEYQPDLLRISSGRPSAES